MRFFLIFMLFFSFGLFATDDFWDGEEYHYHSSSQKESASDLMKLIPITGSENVLDVGCGDGKITAALSKKLTLGHILGIDLSPSMIYFASQLYPESEYPNLQFELMSAEEVNFDQIFDLVVSFTAFQWIRDHSLVIRNIAKSLKSGGIYGVTMPVGLPKELEQAVNEVINQDRWGRFFVNFDSGWNFVGKEGYQALLEVEGFTVETIQVVPQEDLFPSLEVFRGFISQWFPYLRALPISLRDMFMDDVLNRYLELKPLDCEGVLHFKVHRLEAVARS